jgi:hypothetical protein
MKKTTFLVSGIITFILVGCGTSSIGTTADILNTMNSANAGSAVSSAAATTASAGAHVLGTLYTNATSGNNLENIITSVIGLDKVSKKGLIGTWKYKEPGCAFTSKSTLASAGGEVVAATVKHELESSYRRIGVNSGNTLFTFKQDGTFEAKVLGMPWSGRYTFNESNQAIKLSGLLFNIDGFTKRNSDGIALLFESKKVLSLIKTLSALSGNSTVGAIGDLSSNYDGVRVGFDLKK